MIWFTLLDYSWSLREVMAGTQAGVEDGAIEQCCLLARSMAQVQQPF